MHKLVPDPMLTSFNNLGLARITNPAKEATLCFSH
jgi:hypothetical protein